jgi:hypothetical protein
MLLGLQMTMTSMAIPASFFSLLKSIVFLKAAEEYHLLPDTLYLTVNYIDRFFFLTIRSIAKGYNYLVLLACL